MAWYLKIEVTIKTTKGEFNRQSDVVSFANGVADDLSIYQGLLAYPDKRATQFKLYSSSTGVLFNLCKTVNGDLAVFSTVQAPVGNIAYVEIPNIDLTNQGELEPLPTNVPTNKDTDPNRLLASYNAQPFWFPAKRAEYIGTSDSNRIMAFAANTREVSEGQFGFAPVLVVSNQTVTAMEIGQGDALFSRPLPIASRGTVSRYGVANAEGLILFTARDGVWALSPKISRDPISSDLHSYGTGDDILDELDENVSLEYVDDGLGNREVWLATASKIYAYAPSYRRWYTIDRIRPFLFAWRNRLFSYDELYTSITEEVKEVDTGLLSPAGVPVRLKTATFKLGVPGVVKRLYRFAVRQRDKFDQLAFNLLDPVDSREDPVVARTEVDVTTTETVHQAYFTSLEVFSGGQADVNTQDAHVVALVEGFPMGEGVLLASGNTDVVPLTVALGHDFFAKMEGKGKPGQGIEGFDIDVEPRLGHRERNRRVASTLEEIPETVFETVEEDPELPPLGIPSFTVVVGHEQITVTVEDVEGATGYDIEWADFETPPAEPPVVSIPA